MDFYSLGTCQIISIAQQTPFTWFKICETVPCAIDLEEWHVNAIKYAYSQKTKKKDSVITVHYLNSTPDICQYIQDNMEFHKQEVIDHDNTKQYHDDGCVWCYYPPIPVDFLNMWTEKFKFVIDKMVKSSTPLMATLILPTHDEEPLFPRRHRTYRSHMCHITHMVLGWCDEVDDKFYYDCETEDHITIRKIEYVDEIMED
jgi:hypothetical protein